MDKALKIIKHPMPLPVNDIGDILSPFDGWEKTQTGGGWYSKPDEMVISKTPYLPLSHINPNPWKALEQAGVNTAEFRDHLKYKCPYTDLTFYWSIPIAILASEESIKQWIDKSKMQEWRKQLCRDPGWIKKFSPLAGKGGFKFTRIQRSMLGTGYTEGTRIQDGEGYLYDACVAISNGDLLASKVWIWFNK